jgi:peroxiredoxin Q/BCP
VRDVLPELAATGVAVIGISPYKVTRLKQSGDTYGLGFPLLGDSDNRIAEACCVWGKKKR